MTRSLVALLFVAVVATAFASSASADIIHHWKLDESSGVIADDAQNNQDGTVNSGTWVPTGGKIDGALDLKMSNLDYVDVGSDLLGQTFTVTAWIKGASFASGVHNVIFSQYSEDPGRFYMDVYDGNFGIYQGDGPGVVSGSALNPDQWYHVAFVKDGANGTGYLDGASDFTTAAMVDIDTAGAFCRIGARDFGTGPGNVFDGLVDDVRIYNTALSQGDIQAIMEVPEPGTMTLLSIGLVYAGLCTWRKRHR